MLQGLHFAEFPVLPSRLPVASLPFLYTPLWCRVVGAGRDHHRSGEPWAAVKSNCQKQLGFRG